MTSDEQAAQEHADKLFPPSKTATMDDIPMTVWCQANKMHYKTFLLGCQHKQAQILRLLRKQKDNCAGNASEWADFIESEFKRLGEKGL